MNTLFSVRRSRVAGSDLWSLGTYAGLLGRAIKAIKNDGRRDLARAVCRVAGPTLVGSMGPLNGKVSVLAVPSSRRGWRFRGFSLPEYLAQSVRSQTRWEKLADPFRKAYVGGDKTSRRLGRAQRFDRQAHLAKQSTPVLGSGALVLVDDVLTTGATMERCVEIARSQGFGPIVCLVLAEHRQDR